MQRRPDEMGGYGRPQPEETKLISKNKLVLLAKDIDPHAILEDDVIDLLLTLSEDFIDTVVSGSCALGKCQSEPKHQTHTKPTQNCTCWIEPYGYIFS